MEDKHAPLSWSWMLFTAYCVVHVEYSPHYCIDFMDLFLAEQYSIYHHHFKARGYGIIIPIAHERAPIC